MFSNVYLCASQVTDLFIYVYMFLEFTYCEPESGS